MEALMTVDEKLSEVEIVARWIFEECDNPIDEIEWLLSEYYGVCESQLESDYDAVINRYNERNNND